MVTTVTTAERGNPGWEGGVVSMVEVERDEHSVACAVVGYMESGLYRGNIG